MSGQGSCLAGWRHCACLLGGEWRNNKERQSTKHGQVDEAAGAHGEDLRPTLLQFVWKGNWLGGWMPRRVALGSLMRIARTTQLPGSGTASLRPQRAPVA